MWDLDKLPEEQLIYSTTEMGVAKDAAHTSEYTVPADKTLLLDHVVPSIDGPYRAEFTRDVLGTPITIVWHSEAGGSQDCFPFGPALVIKPGMVIWCQVYNLTGAPSQAWNTFMGRLVPKT